MMRLSLKITAWCLLAAIVLSSSAHVIAPTVFFPANNAVNVCADTPIKITFDAAPTMGTSGMVKIYKSGGTLVDTLDVAPPQTRTVGGTPHNAYHILVSDSAASIFPHSGVLTFNTTYCVINDATIFSSYAGMRVNTAWQFTTKTTAVPSSSGTYFTVAADGSANCCTIQGAVSYAQGDNVAFLQSGSNPTINLVGTIGPTTMTANAYMGGTSVTGGSLILANAAAPQRSERRRAEPRSRVLAPSVWRVVLPTRQPKRLPVREPDRDGIENLLEDALDGKSALSNPGLLPRMRSGPANAIFVFTCLLDSAQDSTLTYECGSRLAGRTPVAISPIAASGLVLGTGWRATNGDSDDPEVGFGEWSSVWSIESEPTVMAVRI